MSISQAIVTRHLPATNTLPARIRAYCERGSLMVAYDHEGVESAHRKAIEALVKKFLAEDRAKYGPSCANPWGGPYTVGALPRGNRDSYVAVYL